MSNALQAKGTLIQREDSEGSATYTTIPEVKDINGPNLQSSDYDATTHDTSGKFKEFKAGLIDPGEITFTLNYIPGNTFHNTLASDQSTFTERNYKMVHTNGKFWAFRAYPKFSVSAPVDGLLSANVALRIVQAPTYPTT